MDLTGGFREIQDEKAAKTVYDKQIQPVVATGGTDIAEDLNSALKFAADLKGWSEGKANYTLIITDAPGHGRAFLSIAAYDSQPNVSDVEVKQAVEKLDAVNQSDVYLLTIGQKTQDNKQDDGRFVQMENFFKRTMTKRKFNSVACRIPYSEPICHHFIFVLDESGSMTEQCGGSTKFQQLIDSLNHLISWRVGTCQAAEDLISLRFFDDNLGRNPMTCERVRITDCKNLSSGPTGGGTNFKPALKDAARIATYNTPTSHIPIVVFMSDGEDSASGPIVPSTDFSLPARAKVYTCLFSPTELPNALARLTEIQKCSPSNPTKPVAHVKSRDELSRFFQSTVANLESDVQRALGKSIIEQVKKDVAQKIFIDHW